MPVEELASGLFGFIGRIFGYILIDIVLEILVRGVGYLIIKALPFSNNKEVDPDSFGVLMAGVIFWVLIGVLFYWVVSTMGSNGVSVELKELSS